MLCAGQVSFHCNKENQQYYDISVKSKHDFEKPFLCMQLPTGKGSDVSPAKGLARKLANDTSLTFVESTELVYVHCLISAKGSFGSTWHLEQGMQVCLVPF